jgi:hypothetical protein
VAETERPAAEPIEPIERPAREPIELTESHRGTHLIMDVALPDGFVLPSAALAPDPAQSATNPIAADGQASATGTSSDADQQRPE